MYPNGTFRGQLDIAVNYSSQFISLVEGENYTSGGVCIIGGDVSNHTQQRDCEVAGGVWHN